MKKMLKIKVKTQKESSAVERTSNDIIAGNEKAGFWFVLNHIIKKKL